MRLICLGILAAIPFSADSMCIARYPSLVSAKVTDCNPVEIGPSPVRKKLRRGRFTYMDDTEPVKGTLLDIEVLSEQPVTLKAAPEESAEIKKRLPENTVLFVDGVATEVCPKELPSQMHVIIDPPCCDTLPPRGLCRVSLTVAEIETDPGRWQVVAPHAIRSD